MFADMSRFSLFIHMDIRTIPKDVIEKTIKESISWSESMRKLGKTPRGSSFQYFQAKVRKFNIDTSHFLGVLANNGLHKNGSNRKKHWKEILIKNKTKQREKNSKLRKAYREYCNANNISIECVDCKNKGIWREKTLRLQINHKDIDHSNNAPENLEWLCPNCHDIKTIY